MQIENKRNLERLQKISDYAKKNKAMRKEAAAVEVKDLVIDYGETLAVDGVSFKINQGELVTLLGPSGCGKTTTLNAIAGLLTPSSGDILFRGKNVTKASPQMRKLGLVFQNYALYPHMSVYKNIAFPLYNDSLWKENLKIRNMKFQHEADMLRLKSYKVSPSEIKPVNSLFYKWRRTVRETKDHLESLQLQKGKRVSELKSAIELAKVKGNSQIVNLNRKTLKAIETAEQKLTLAKTSAKRGVLSKEKLDEEFKKFKEKVDTIRKNSREELAKLRAQNKEAYNAAKIDYLNAKKESIAQKKEQVREIKQAKLDAHDVPRIARAAYKEALKRLFEENKHKPIDEKTKLKINELESKVLSLREAVHKEVMEVAERVNIVKALKKRPTRLSGGQQQRVAIARGIVRKPKILLMDEPLSNLDAKLRVTTREWIKSIVKEVGMTTIFVTHDQEEAMSISDKVVVMSDGLIQQVGSPMELYAKPKNKFVAQFLGMPEMKIFKADVSKTGIVSINGKKIFAKNKKDLKPGKVELGIRAEHITETTKGKGISGKIVDVEYLGRETLATIKFEGHGEGRVYLRKKSNYKPGEELSFKFPESKVYLFDRNGDVI